MKPLSELTRDPKFIRAHYAALQTITRTWAWGLTPDEYYISTYTGTGHGAPAYQVTPTPGTGDWQTIAIAHPDGTLTQPEFTRDENTNARLDALADTQ